MALTMVSRRLGARHLAVRAFSEGSGRILSEEEKAAENVYIKKMEQEKLEKLARKGVKPEEQHSGSGATSGSQSSESAATNTGKNVAVLAGVVAVVAGIWWFVGSDSKEKEQRG